MKKSYNKIILSGVLSLTILCSSLSVAAYSAGENSVNVFSDINNVQKDALEADYRNISKNETVYVIANADGETKKIIVSDWIKNVGDNKKINDVSNLENIENIKGNETYTINENNMYQWNADGKDIYYQGTGKGELPVKLKISYTLDDKRISAEDLAGKSGKVKIRFDYNNTQYENVKINGKEEKIYVPFLMMTGMALDNEIFSDVEITNGKIINDGNRTFVAGFALPGMQESLGINKDKFEIPEYFEITANVKNFELTTTLSLAVNDFFSNIDFSDADKGIDSLTKSLEKLKSASNKLIDGSSALYDGLGTLLDKSNELVSGVQKLRDGAEKLNNGANALDDGAAELASGAKSLDDGAGKLKDGSVNLYDGFQSLYSGTNALNNGVADLKGYIETLSIGLDTISQNSNTLNAGAEQVFNTLLSTADSQIAAAGLSADKLTIENYSKVLDSLINSLSDENAKQLAYNTALEAVSTTVNNQRDVIRTAVEATVRKQIIESVLNSAGYSMTAEAYDIAVAAGDIPNDVQVQISTAVAAQISSSDIQAIIENNTEQQIQNLIDTNMNSREVQNQIAQGIEKAKAGRNSLSALKEQLNSYNEFYQGIIGYTNGVDSASAGAREILNGTSTLKNGSDSLKNGTSQLKTGAGTLKQGASELKNGSSALKAGSEKLSIGAGDLNKGTRDLFSGIGTLHSGSGALIDGIKQLKNGSMSLNSGLKQFKKDGVDTIVNAVDGDIKGLVNRFKAISKVSGNYKSYSGIAKDMNGKTDFIFKTDSIESKTKSDNK